MTRTHKVMILLVVVSAGVWGCSQGENKSAAARHLDRIKALEAKCASLEHDCQAMLASRDQAQKRQAELEMQCARLKKEIDGYKVVAHERDDLKSLVTARTTERDSYQTQLMEVRKGIRTLLSRVESCLPTESGDQKTSVSPRL